MEKIMKASGLSKGLVYHYFPSKEKVFFHLVDTALEISKNTWQDAFDSPGTAWEKIEKLSENIVKIAFTDESSLYSLIMIQAVTEGKGIPGSARTCLPKPGLLHGTPFADRRSTKNR